MVQQVIFISGLINRKMRGNFYLVLEEIFIILLIEADKYMSVTIVE